MPKPASIGGKAVAVLGSGRLALVLVLFIILIALGGALLPQQGKVEPLDILKWQEGHPVVSALLRPLGLFRVFHSFPFLAAVFLLFLNTLTCTLRRLFQPESRLLWQNFRDIRAAGFLGLHISLLLLMGGGLHSGATRMDGYLVLTEGQSLEEEAGSYVMLAEGPLRRNKHRGFQVRLKEVTASYDSAGRLREASPVLEFESGGRQTHSGMARLNHPVSFLNVAFTLDETGFAPRLRIRKRGEDISLIDSFVALKTFRKGPERDYRDFLNLPFLGEKIFVRFLPDSENREGGPVKLGDRPGNSLLHLWTENEVGSIVGESIVHPGETAGLADYEFTFLEFRKWASFRVVQDSGTAWVFAALWLGLGSLILRYVPEVKRWFSPRSENNDASGGQRENDPR